MLQLCWQKPVDKSYVRFLAETPLAICCYFHFYVFMCNKLLNGDTLKQNFAHFLTLVIWSIIFPPKKFIFQLVLFMIDVTFQELVRSTRGEIRSYRVQCHVLRLATLEKDLNTTTLMTLTLHCLYPYYRFLKLQPFHFSHFYSPYPTLPPSKKKYSCSFVSIERKFADFWVVCDSAHSLLYFSVAATKSAGIFIFIFHLSLLPLSPSFPSFTLQRVNYTTSFFPAPHFFALGFKSIKYWHKQGRQITIMTDR